MPTPRRTFLQAAGAMALLSFAGCAAAPAPAPSPAAPPPPPPPMPPFPKATDTKKKILILGGTGFLGPKLVESAQARGHTLTLFNRGKTNPHLFPDVEKLRGDRDGDLKALEGRTWDAVIDTSGYVPRVVKASADLLSKAVKQYLFVSTISVFEDTSKPGIDESWPVAKLSDPKNEDVRQNYGALKALCEQAAEASMPGRVTNIRPGLIVGPGDPTDRFTYWPVRVDRGGEVLAPGNGADPVQFVDVRDLAAWMILTIEQGVMGLFNATGPERELTMRAFLDACKASIGGSAALTWVDTGFLEQQKVEPWSDMPVWIPAAGENLGAAKINCAKAIARGLRFRPPGDTAKDTLEWWKTLPEERRAKMRSGVTAEREAAVLAEWKKKSGAKPAKKTGLLFPDRAGRRPWAAAPAFGWAAG